MKEMMNGKRVRKFPVFLDIAEKEIHVYGAGRIAGRRVETLLLFAPCLTVHAPEVSVPLQKAASEGKLRIQREVYQPGSIPADAFMVLAATDDSAVNNGIYEECQEKGILVNVCSDRTRCDFHFPGIAVKEDLVIGINAGGKDHSLAKKWTDRIRKEVEEDGYDNQAEKASDNGNLKEDGAGDTDG
ncbi:MAG: bifunctional precorrin-2 dehydrogenase/sirohydrochlorin ferrochelatase [Lachnospiraceae bacterium]|jgi:precorrin-2 dehydrogenase/sirohydrochlorin ferrochelatase|nr:bifunctional precorrin-2 dehydrogenase/sirohydrochlorin ferrochelatase [Lachnospiraceae bacterium]MCI9599740.1 bifunctional precorrin-2 dehydrogenase/sirohydrochlorin ferrochelatase [Lachnospiraceae bacterium]